MTRAILLIYLVFSGTTYVVQAQQQMPDMPGMNMPGEQQKKPALGANPPNQRQNLPDTMPKDMQPMDQEPGDEKGRPKSLSEPSSLPQQAELPGTKPGNQSDRRTITVPTQEMQEPEALNFHTGDDLPAPELLGEVVKRDPMTLEQFLALADRSNPTLAQARDNIDRSKAQGRQASLAPDPIVGYSGDHIRGGEYHGGEQGAFVSQEFVLGHKLALRRDVYRAEGRSNEYALEAQRARVHNDVAREFFDTLAAQESVILHGRLLKLALDTERNTHELARIGQEDAAGILTAEVATEQAGIEFETAQRLFLAHFTQMATMAGQSTLLTHPLTGDLVAPPELNAEEYVHRGVEDSPLVRYAQADEALGEARIQDARRERIPNLNVTAGEWYSGEAVSSGKKAGWEGFVQAGVQIPVWNRNQGNIDASKALLDRAHKDVQRTKMWTRNQAEQLAQQYLTERFTATRYRTEMIPRARRAYQLQVTKYQEMALDYPSVLAAQHMLFTLQLRYADALDQEWGAAIALENYALVGGLQEPISTGTDSTTINVPTATGDNP